MKGSRDVMMNISKATSRGVSRGVSRDGVAVRIRYEVNVRTNFERG